MSTEDCLQCYRGTCEKHEFKFVTKLRPCKRCGKLNSNYYVCTNCRGTNKAREHRLYDPYDDCTTYGSFEESIGF